MPIVRTHDLLPGQPIANSLQIYNGLDACLTVEVFEEISSLRNDLPAAYDFERALQGPVLEMMMRGFKVNEFARQQALKGFRSRLTRLLGERIKDTFAPDGVLQRFAAGVWGNRSLNPRSNPQLKEFFYEFLKLPEVWKSDKGERRLSFDRESLEKLSQYWIALPIVNAILAIRDLAKLIEILETEISPDGRMRSSYNIAGTETWRFSSSADAFGDGGNVQNWPPELRQIFEPDDGKILIVIDLEQAESREIGWKCGILFDDWKYLDLCESADLHTRVCQMVWPGLPWTGDAVKDKHFANTTPFYRDYPYRDATKKLGHGCLTVEHEVLTPAGWVPIASKPSRIMSWGESESSFADVSHWTDEWYDGILQIFEGTSISLAMTHDHRVPYKADVRTKIKERPAEQGPGRFMPLGNGFVGGSLRVPARLIAAFMSDGHQHSKNSMKFHFHKQRKKDRLKELCDRYGFSWRDAFPHIYVEGKLPRRAGSFMFEWHKDDLAEFLDEYKFWDGHQVKTSVTLSSTDREHLEWLQTLGRLCGIGGNIQKPHISGFGSTVYSLQQNNRQWASGDSIMWANCPVEMLRVLCPTVPSGWFYVRRGGKICVTGNTNYYGMPPGLSRRLHIPLKLVTQFREDYMGEFPAIDRFHRWTAEQIQTKPQDGIDIGFGFIRHFFGRPDDETTLREAIAAQGQCPTAVRTNLGLYRIWKKYPKDVQILAQTHDSVTSQVDVRAVDELVPLLVEEMRTSVVHKGREFIVPGEAKVGFNWNNAHDPSRPIGPKNKPNPNGLRKWKPGMTWKRLSTMEQPL